MEYEVQRTGAFDVWLDGLADRIASKAIVERIVRIKRGLIGNRRTVGDGVSEVKIDVGQGYRLYYTMRGTVLHLLCGGTKKTQRSDIRRAEAMANALGKGKKDTGRSRVRERQAAYAPEGGQDDEFHFTEEELKLAPFDAADYIRDDEEAQLYLMRSALAEGHPGLIADVIGAVARARGLTNLERATGIKRQTLNKSLSLKGNPTLETLVTVLGALGLRLEIVADRGEG